METKFDEYYKKEIPYKVSYRELQNSIYLTQEKVLAYFRGVGVENVRVEIEFPTESRNIKKIVCKMINIDDPTYNPLIERDVIQKNHWYHPYKIEFTPVDYEGVTERFYFSDFCSMLESGHAKIIHKNDNELTITCDICKDTLTVPFDPFSNGIVINEVLKAIYPHKWVVCIEGTACPKCLKLNR